MEQLWWNSSGWNSSCGTVVVEQLRWNSSGGTVVVEQ